MFRVFFASTMLVGILFFVVGTATPHAARAATKSRMLQIRKPRALKKALKAPKRAPRKKSTPASETSVANTRKVLERRNSLLQELK